MRWSAGRIPVVGPWALAGLAALAVAAALLLREGATRAFDAAPINAAILAPLPGTLAREEQRDADGLEVRWSLRTRLPPEAVREAIRRACRAADMRFDDAPGGGIVCYRMDGDLRVAIAPAEDGTTQVSATEGAR